MTISEGKIEEAKEMRRSGATLGQIADELGASKATWSRKLREITPPSSARGGKKQPEVPESEKEEAEESYDSFLRLLGKVREGESVRSDILSMVGKKGSKFDTNEIFDILKLNLLASGLGDNGGNQGDSGSSDLEGIAALVGALRSDEGSSEVETLRSELSDLRQQLSNQRVAALGQKVSELEKELERRPPSQSPAYALLSSAQSDLSDIKDVAVERFKKAPIEGQEFSPERSRSPEERRQKADKILGNIEKASETVDKENDFLSSSNKMMKEGEKVGEETGSSTE